jgi:hypothetical protein
MNRPVEKYVPNNEIRRAFNDFALPNNVYKSKDPLTPISVDSVVG